jgi:hypothetical protein
LTSFIGFWYYITSFNETPSRQPWRRERREGGRFGREEAVVSGLIRARDVVRHPVLVIRGFGWRCFFRCLSAAAHGSGATFLAIALAD